jgi:hypothetical protein
MGYRIFCKILGFSPSKKDYECGLIKFRCHQSSLGYVQKILALDDFKSNLDNFHWVAYPVWTNLHSLQFGRISGYFQYPVSGKANPVSGRIPDIKKAEFSGQPDIRCIPSQN